MRKLRMLKKSWKTKERELDLLLKLQTPKNSRGSNRLSSTKKMNRRS
jgi:hypothetical protein